MIKLHLKDDRQKEIVTDKNAFRRKEKQIKGAICKKV